MAKKAIIVRHEAGKYSCKIQRISFLPFYKDVKDEDGELILFHYKNSALGYLTRTYNIVPGGISFQNQK